MTCTINFIQEDHSNLIRFSPGFHVLKLDPSKTVLQHCLDHGISLPHACGGEAKCSTCRVVILEGAEFCNPPSIEEEELSKRFSFPKNIRLGCQLRANQGISLRKLILDSEDQLMVSLSAQEKRPIAVGVEISMAILFIDIRGFTHFSEQLLPYDIVHALNRFFHQMGEAIKKFGGEVNNYTGDGFMALFSQGDSISCCRQAVQAGFEMIRRMESVRDYICSLHGRTFQMGIGIHYGKVIYGTFGHQESQRMTAIGDAVNFASRVEGMTKEIGVEMLVSEGVYEHLKSEFLFSKKSEIPIRGKSGLFQLFTVVEKES